GSGGLPPVNNPRNQKTQLVSGSEMHLAPALRANITEQMLCNVGPMTNAALPAKIAPINTFVLDALFG
ncbi:MAG TPA: hypothetical protein V6D06_02295, partial [Trichocoleus sp.]